MNYPIICIPKRVYEIKNIFNNPPEPPQKPPIPKKNYPEVPLEPVKESGFTAGYIISFFFFLIGLTLLTNESGWGIFLTIIGILIFIIVQSGKNQANRIFEKKKIQHFGEYSKYVDDLLSLDDRYELQLKNYYKKTLPEYKSSYSKYMEFIYNRDSKSYRQQYIFNNLQDFFSSSTKPQKISLNVLVGQTEQFFFNHLKEYFYDTVYKNLGIIVDNFEGEPYVPDFVIYIEELNLCLDIEIDEPYSTDKKPIHYIAGNDIHRNSFFNNNKWIVIRFAEIQIIRQPNECCELIQNVINFIYNENETTKNNLENIKKHINNIPRWTESDAIWLANQQFRNLYYENNQAENIINELVKKKNTTPLLDTISNEESDDLPF